MMFTIVLTSPKREVNYALTTLEYWIVKQASNVATKNHWDRIKYTNGVYLWKCNEANTNKGRKIVRLESLEV